MACLQTELERCFDKFANSEAVRSASATLSQLIYEARHSLILKSYLRAVGASSNEVVPDPVSQHIREQAGDCSVTLGRLTLVDGKTEFSCINLMDLSAVASDSREVSESLILEVIPSLLESGGMNNLMQQFVSESGIDLETVKACARRFADSAPADIAESDVVSSLTLCCLTLIINPRFSFQIDRVSSLHELINMSNGTFVLEIVKAMLPPSLSRYVPLIKTILPTLGVYRL